MNASCTPIAMKTSEKVRTRITAGAVRGPKSTSPHRHSDQPTPPTPAQTMHSAMIRPRSNDIADASAVRRRERGRKPFTPAK